MLSAPESGTFPSMRTAPGTRSPRFPFIDVLRGLAVAVMIETHVLNALLDPALRRGLLHQAVAFVNGLVAPAFLFCAGLGFAILLSRREEEIVRFGGAFRSTARRCLFILFLGYTLHAPVWSLRAMTERGLPAWREMAQVDILQVIGAGLLILLLAAALLRRRAARQAAAAALAAGAVVWGYLLPEGTGGVLPFWLEAYVSREISPLFTLTPWLAFLIAGYLAGVRFAAAAALGPEEERAEMTRIAVGAAFLVAAGAGIGAFTVSLYPGDAFWHRSAEYVAVRLGAVALAMWGLWYALRRGEGAASVLLGVFGRESLGIYYAHLLIVYGRDIPWSFVRLWEPGFGYGGVLALSAALAAAMVLFGWGWARAKRSHPRAAALAVRALAAGAVISFVAG